jgi:2-C-methyl-D-erythritol 4-phosphate cytidylyltransferase
VNSRSLGIDARLLVPAAGMGKRLGSPRPKALAEIAGEALIVRTLGRFDTLGLVDESVVVYPPGFEDNFRSVLQESFPRSRIHLCEGGEERQDSVSRGLALVDPQADFVIIHDAARPFIEPETIVAAIRAAEDAGASTVATPAIDTILEDDGAGNLARTPDRKHVWACQTPQVFRLDVIRAAHARAARAGTQFTDDATLVHSYGGRVRIVPGSARNFKITTEEDARHAEYLFRRRGE